MGVTLLMLTVHAAWAAETITWKIASLEWPPYASNHINDGGLAIAALRTALASQGINLQVEYMPWSSAQQAAQSKNYIGYFPAWPSEVKPGFIASAPVLYSHLGVVAPQNNAIEYQDLLHLMLNHKMGVVDSYVYPDSVQHLMDAEADNIVKAATDSALLALLTQHNIDVAITDPLVLDYLASQQGIAKPEVITQFVDVPLVLAMRDSVDNLHAVNVMADLFEQKTDVQARFERPASVLISYFEHPSIAPFVELIKGVYADLGIATRLMPVPAKRGLMLLDAGVVDADVIRISQNVTEFENIIVVEPPLADVELALVCVPKVPCNRQVLGDPNARILTSLGSMLALEQFDIQAQMSSSENLQGILEMLKKQHVKYALYGLTESLRDELADDFQVVNLRKVRLNHVINKKYAPMLPDIQRALEGRLIYLQK